MNTQDNTVHIVRGCDCCKEKHADRPTMFTVERYNSANINDYKVIDVCIACFDNYRDLILILHNTNMPVSLFAKEHKSVRDSQGLSIYLNLCFLTDSELEKQLKKLRKDLPEFLKTVFDRHQEEIHADVKGQKIM